MKKIDIVIPVYNEGENILPVLKVLSTYVRHPFRVLIGYDFEEDDTVKVIRSIIDSPMEIVLVRNPGRGPHSAVLECFRFSDAEAVLVYLADDMYNARIVDDMVEKFEEGNDIVVASRFMKGGEMSGRSFLKGALVRLASFMLYYFAGLPVHDATYASRLFSKRVVKNIEIESNDGFVYSIELLVKCHRLGWPIVEVPACWYERVRGKSRFKFKKWLPLYARWFWYAFATTYLRRRASTVLLRQE